jgi:hypothetical protein
MAASYTPPPPGTGVVVNKNILVIVKEEKVKEEVKVKEEDVKEDVKVEKTEYEIHTFPEEGGFCVVTVQVRPGTLYNGSQGSIQRSV